MKVNATHKIAFMGLLLALSIVLSIVEGFIPPIPTLPPGIRLGFSNIIVMYALLCLSKLDTMLIVFVKSAFVFLTRGVTAGLMSLFGGASSALIMIVLLVIFKDKISILCLSILGAVVHNSAQIAVAILIMQNTVVIYYLPILVVAGVIMGYVTGTLLKLVMPAIMRINKYEKGDVSVD